MLRKNLILILAGALSVLSLASPIQMPAAAAASPATVEVIPAHPIKGEWIRFDGNIGTPVVRPVVLQRLVKKSWVTLLADETDTDGSFILMGDDDEGTAVTISGSSATFRIHADATTVDAIDYPETSKTFVVTTVKQSVKSTSIPKRAYQGQSIQASYKVSPSRVRDVTLQIRKGGAWVATDAGDVAFGTKGKITFTTGSPGTYYYRVVFPSESGRPTLAGPKMKIKVKSRRGYHAKAVAVGGGFACAINMSDSVDCWGYNIGGLKSQAESVKKPSPVLGLANVKAISAAEQTVCVVTIAGVPECWGDNTFGQLGDGTTDYGHTPKPIPGVTGASAVSVSGATVCVLLDDGRVSCQGYNSLGQLGRPLSMSEPTPAIVPGLNDVLQIATGGDVTCAVMADASVKCLGYNGDGNLGAGPAPAGTYFSLTPVQSIGLSAITKVASSTNINSSQSCAVSATGSLKCWPWGRGANKDLPPTEVENVTDVVDVAMGDSARCLVQADGTAKCWGENIEAVLGLGYWGDSGEVVDTPQRVAFMRDAKQVSVGYDSACAIQTSGQVMCWGDDEVGQLGDGAKTRNRSTPTSVVAP